MCTNKENHTHFNKYNEKASFFRQNKNINFKTQFTASGVGTVPYPFYATEESFSGCGLSEDRRALAVVTKILPAVGGRLGLVTDNGGGDR